MSRATPAITLLWGTTIIRLLSPILALTLAMSTLPALPTLSAMLSTSQKALRHPHQPPRATAPTMSALLTAA